MRIQRWNDRVDPAPGTMNGRGGGDGVATVSGSSLVYSRICLAGDQSGREFKTWCHYVHEHNKLEGCICCLRGFNSNMQYVLGHVHEQAIYRVLLLSSYRER